MRILTQLDDAVDGRTLWSESYDRKLADLFVVQQALYPSRRYDETIEWFRKAIALNPSFPRDATITLIKVR